MSTEATNESAYKIWSASVPSITLINHNGMEGFSNNIGYSGMAESQIWSRVYMYGEAPGEFMVLADTGIVVTGETIETLDKAGLLGFTGDNKLPGTIVEQISKDGGTREVLSSHAILPPSRLAAWLFYNYDALDQAYKGKIAENGGMSPIDGSERIETLDGLLGRLIINELHNSDNGIALPTTEVNLVDDYTKKRFSNLSLQMGQINWLATCLDTLVYYDFAGADAAEGLTRLAGYLRDRVTSVTNQFNRSLAAKGRTMSISVPHKSLTNIGNRVTQTVTIAAYTEAGVFGENICDFRASDVVTYCPQLVEYGIEHGLLSGASVTNGSAFSFEMRHLLDLVKSNQEALPDFDRLLRTKIAGNISHLTMYLDASKGFADERLVNARKMKMVEIARLIDFMVADMDGEDEGSALVTFGSRASYKGLQMDILRMISVIESFYASDVLSSPEVDFLREKAGQGEMGDTASIPTELTRERRLPILVDLLTKTGQTIQNVAA